MNYLIWKTDGNADGLHTPLRIHALSPNGTTLAPKMGDWHTTQLITNDLDGGKKRPRTHGDDDD